MFKQLCCVVVALTIIGCADTDVEVTEKIEATSDTWAELVERQSFFDNPTRVQGRISPDGQWVSWLAPVAGVMNVWIGPSAEPSLAKAVTLETGRGIPIHYWSFDSKHIFYTKDKGGNENYHLYAVSVESSETRPLTPVADDVRAVVYALGRERPNTVIVGLNERDPQRFDLFEINIATAERTLLLQNPGFSDFGIDNNLIPRTAVRQLEGGAQTLVSLDTDEHTVLATFSVEDVMTSGVIGFDAANEHVYALDSRDRDTAALVKISLATGVTTLLAADPQADISEVLFDPISHLPLAYAAEFKTMVWRGMDDKTSNMLQNISDNITGNLAFVAQSSDAQQLVIAANAPTQASTYYIYNRADKTVVKMFETRPAMAEVSLQPMQPVVIKSRDGLNLVSYLTLPELGAARDRPDAPLPMVLYVHGGPWARDGYGYNATHQWLSDRGYAVLSVNYRGSTGFGKSFVNAAKMEFAGKMHDDLVDAVNWAVQEGIADPDNIAIMGGSYGGYATLVGLTFTPDVFACGVDIVGPSNLITLINSFPAYWRPQLESNWFAYVGDPENEAQKADMYNRSPISRVADIQAPLLIGQGENDPRVTKSESDQIVAAMQKRNLPVTYLNYPDEGHGFARAENRLSFYAVTEAFLSQCLGGRYQPIGDDFDGSSIQILHGVEYVPGLQAEGT